MKLNLRLRKRLGFSTPKLEFFKQIAIFALASRSCKCFESVCSGINMNTDEKTEIISVARVLNPDIKIPQMAIDANAFK